MALGAFVLVNGLIVAAWWSWLVRRHGERGVPALVFAVLLGAVQIMASETALGMLGLLRRTWLVMALLAVSALVGASARAAGPRVTAGLARPEPAEPGGVRDPAVLLLALLGSILAGWIALATWLLPPRGVDDLAYHLPPLYQYAQSGRIELLPLGLRAQFAMPQGGSFLYLWPLVFFGDDTWVDGMQFVAAAHAALVLYALAQALGAARRDALFVALLFPLTPVVMAQSGSNYTDVIVAACHLVLLYALVRVWQGGAQLHVVMAGLASGFGLSVKYNMLVAIAVAQPLLVLALWRARGLTGLLRGYAVYVPWVLLLPGYWLVRNWLQTGHPLFPYALGWGGLSDLGVLPELVGWETPGGGAALARLVEDPVRMLRFLLQDPGLGSLNGGLGLAFWACGVPALAWWAARALRGRDALAGLLLLNVPVVGLTYLAQTDVLRLPFNMRLVTVLVPLGLLALALFLGRLRSTLPIAAGAVRALGVGGAALALVQLAGTQLPSFAVSDALADRRAGTVTTDRRYYRGAHGDLPALADALEPLDYLTREGAGWSVYMAADWNVFMTAPLFGGALQNRVWNFADSPGAWPDAFLFHAGPGRGIRRFHYVGERITPEQVAADPRYALYWRSPSTELWIARERLADPRVRTSLGRFCGIRHAPEMAALAPVVAGLPAAEALVTSSPLAQALRCLEFDGTLATPVHLVAPGGELAGAQRLGARRVITVGPPLPGVPARRLASVPTGLGSVPIYLCELSPRSE